MLRAGAICVPVNFRMVRRRGRLRCWPTPARWPPWPTTRVRGPSWPRPATGRPPCAGSITDRRATSRTSSPRRRRRPTASSPSPTTPPRSSCTPRAPPGRPRAPCSPTATCYLHAFSIDLHLGGPGGPSVWPLRGAAVPHRGRRGLPPSLFARRHHRHHRRRAASTPRRRSRVLERERVYVVLLRARAVGRDRARGPGCAGPGPLGAAQVRWGAAPASTTPAAHDDRRVPAGRDRHLRSGRPSAARSPALRAARTPSARSARSARR